ncbi:MAG: cofactor-independent phosphoglycerate mutase [Nitrospirae bacterium]|nr:cofactor-independent phosphoglycerate mutase [Nitrospirota bacterium]
MKYIVIVGDGMGDYPVRELGDRTPLQAAKTPCMDSLAKRGVLGQVKLTPDGFYPGSDVTQLSLLGYDPARYYTGRSPLEAASIGVSLAPDDVAYRCNLVTLTRGGEYVSGGLSDDVVMEDYSGGHIGTKDARELILSLDKELGSDVFRFYPGISYRHLFVWKGGETDVKCTPPHDFTGKPLAGRLPVGKGVDVLNDIMEKALRILSFHHTNKIRTGRGEKPANGIWLWGQGKAPKVQTFYSKYGLNGSMIAAVDLMRGIGKYAGFDVIDVPGATGYLDTNYKGKGEYALRELETRDIVYVHVEAPDEAGHNGDVRGKVKAIEELDEKVLGTILKGMKDKGPFRVLILCDHWTPVSIRTHTPEPVPFILYDSIEATKSGRCYDETNAAESGVFVEDGTRLIDMLMENAKLKIQKSK